MKAIPTQNPLLSTTESKRKQRPDNPLINRAALRRLAHEEFTALGISGRLPPGGLRKLEEYLDGLARKSVKDWAAKRNASWKEDNHA